MSGPAAGWLPDGRLHLQHGPIDLVIRAEGAADEVAAAYRQAWAAFRPVLGDLVSVLPTLRTPVNALIAAGLVRPPRAVGEPALHAPDDAAPAERPAGAAAPLPRRGAGMERGHAPPPGGLVRDRAATAGILPGTPAARMLAAAAAHAPAFVTPMAGVAGAVADHVLAAMTDGRTIQRAHVNNGGDAALWLSPGAELTAAGGPALSDRIRIRHASPARGIATSGWRGRSHSLGIADAVTVLARTATGADVAATLIANAVDLPGHPAVSRRPACELAPDSDLGEHPVTVGVGPLSAAEVARALASGRAAAAGMRRDGLIFAAALWLGGACVTVGEDWPEVPAPRPPC